MAINAFILFSFTVFSGLLVFIWPSFRSNFKKLLSFSGAYLFSITVIHILPELFSESVNPMLTGIFVLIGFYFQIVLDYFSSGVEHGHIHHHDEHSHSASYLLFISLWIHSFMEGTLLVHPHAEHGDSEVQNLAFGLVLHKIPEAFALTSVLLSQTSKKELVAFLLFIFAISSPLGLFASNFLSHNSQESATFFSYLFAVVAGNFLHISTTIFFESESSGHTFKGNKLLITVAGGLLAVGVEYWVR